MEEAGEYAGVKGKTALLHAGPRALIQREAAARIDGLMLWTRDRPLAKAAAELGLRPA